MNKIKRIVTHRQAKWLVSGLIGIYSVNTFYQSKILMDSKDSTFQHQKQIRESVFQQQLIDNKVLDIKVDSDEINQQTAEKNQRNPGQDINQGQKTQQNKLQNEQFNTIDNDCVVEITKIGNDLNERIKKLQKNGALVSSKIPKQITHFLRKLDIQIEQISENQQMLSTYQVVIKNQLGDSKKFNLDTFMSNFSQVRKQVDELYLLSNFLNYPKLINKQQQFLDLFNLLEYDENIVLTILTQKSDQKVIQNAFDTYHQRKHKDQQKIQQRFIHLKNNSTSNKDAYIMVNREVGKILKISQFNTGKVYVINKLGKYSSKIVSNIMINGQRCSIQQYQHVLLQNKNQYHNGANIYDAKLSLSPITIGVRNIHEPKTQKDLDNLIRQIKMHPLLQGNALPKMLVIYNEDRSEQFLTKVDKVLLQTKKMMRNQVVICKIANPKLLEYLTVVPDGYATVRLIQFDKSQTPPIELLKNCSLVQGKTQQSDRQFFSRYKLQGPFNPQNLCRFIQSQDNKQHYEVKSGLSNIFQIGTGQINKLKNSLILFQKFGCAGCNYVKQAMEDLNSIVEKISNQNSKKENRDIKFAYQIEQLDKIKGLKLKRYNILNEEKENEKTMEIPQVTPQLYYVNNGKHCDLKVAQVFAKMNKINFGSAHQGQEQYNQAKHSFIRQIIQQLTQCKKVI